MLLCTYAYMYTHAHTCIHIHVSIYTFTQIFEENICIFQHLSMLHYPCSFLASYKCTYPVPRQWSNFSRNITYGQRIGNLYERILPSAVLLLLFSIKRIQYTHTYVDFTCHISHLCRKSKKKNDLKNHVLKNRNKMHLLIQHNLTII